ncbi:MAG: ATP-binding cassette domain-containing protein [Gammaproteobacteria bacterium]|nr:ATP-binding cassette domain-containing protein [Gammaproteobacteria bacterium]
MLELRGVNTFRGPAHILRDVSLSVHDRELVCLVGRNGAGKTTIIESVMGFLRLRSGQILFRGEDVSSLPVHERARRGIGYAPEGCEIFPDLTVSENLMISRWMSDTAARNPGAETDGDIDERVFAVFPEVRDLLDRRGLNLSGGQRKIVAIARAMELSPVLLLLDEAFEGLAPVVVSRFAEAVRKIRELGVSVLIAESNLMNAVRIADRLYAIDRGEVIFHGDPEQALKEEKVMKALRG